MLFGGGTSISGAIDYADPPSFPENGWSATAHHGRVPRATAADDAGRLPRRRQTRRAVRAGVVINGLPILALEPNLDALYRNNVIGGPGAFVRAVDSFDHFGDAILEKLVAEIAGPAAPDPVRVPVRQASQAGPASNSQD